MSMNLYYKKIDKYLKKKSESSRDLEGARGLLAPKTAGAKRMTGAQQQDIVEKIGDFVADIRKKRLELKSKRKGGK